MRRILGIVCLICAIIFGYLETKHFGNNWLPQTNEEIICDLTSLLLFMVGSFLFLQKRK